MYQYFLLTHWTAFRWKHF